VAHNILKYGAYNRPNFYVRLLNGLAEPPGKDSKMGPRELQNALSVVEHIDYVFLLEGDLQPKIRRATVHKSNCRGASSPLLNHGLHAIGEYLSGHGR
jgi:hypothetical protein